MGIFQKTPDFHVVLCGTDTRFSCLMTYHKQKTTCLNLKSRRRPEDRHNRPKLFFAYSEDDLTAAILQQTAEYIYQLEQEKTRLLSQNCQLKRLVNQQEGEGTASAPGIIAKKRKIDSAIVCESADEGIGSMSPEPASGNPLLTANNTTNTVAIEGDSGNEILRRDIIDLRLQLDRERRLRMHLEEKLRTVESQMYPSDRLREIAPHVQLQYQSHDGIQVMEHNGTHSGNQQTVIEETVVEEMEVPLPLNETEEIIQSPVNMSELLSSTVLPPVVQTQTVSTTLEELSSHIRCKKEPMEDKANPESQSPPPMRLVLRLPSVIEAAIKAEPKVEVERLPTPSGSGEDCVPPSITSRQSLETIVEAIRHLEGDHLFNDIPSPPGHHRSQVLEEPIQEVPLALTTKHQTPQRLIKVDMNPFLKFHTTQSLSQAATATQTTALQQQRPGVIVVKHT
ncbi:hypothetical protein RUM43_011527 [Polyplax serrata]|uniref:Transcription factor AP-4 n=1 Tax=Polyplax serrata TaxID=468196 RepID=A0AAN8NTW6_POLSC